jgi:hypothetical protein
MDTPLIVMSSIYSFLQGQGEELLQNVGVCAEMLGSFILSTIILRIILGVGISELVNEATD